LTPFDLPEAITQAFQTLVRYARSHGWGISGLCGILAPHQRNTYKAFLPLAPESAYIPLFCITEIPRGTYASISISGNRRQTNKTAHYFLQHWLPASGYKIAGTNGLETFTDCPASTPYVQLERQIYIPVEPSL